MVVDVGMFFRKPHVVHEPEARDAHGGKQHDATGEQALHVEPAFVAAVFQDVPESDSCHRIHDPGQEWEV